MAIAGTCGVPGCAAVAVIFIDRNANLSSASSWKANAMNRWLRYWFRDPRSSVTSVMTILCCIGTICGAALIAIVVMR